MAGTTNSMRLFANRPILEAGCRLHYLNLKHSFIVLSGEAERAFCAESADSSACPASTIISIATFTVTDASGLHCEGNTTLEWYVARKIESLLPVRKCAECARVDHLSECFASAPRRKRNRQASPKLLNRAFDKSGCRRLARVPRNSSALPCTTAPPSQSICARIRRSGLYASPSMGGRTTAYCGQAGGQRWLTDPRR